MSIRKILVPLDGSDADRTALETAFAVAIAFEAHVAVVHVRTQAADTLPFLGEGMSAALVQELIELTEQESAARADAAWNVYESTRQAKGLPVADVPSVPEPTVQWLEESGKEEDVIAAEGRLADLIVLARPIPPGNAAGHRPFGIALFETGRPVLVAGTGAASLVGGRITVAWDGSPQAARALAAALPFIARAEGVGLLTAGDSYKDEELAEVAAYLAWHGISVERRVVSPHPSIGEALLAAATAARTDMLVMGGYSHSRLREFILGGITRHMLEQTALPLLLAH